MAGIDEAAKAATEASYIKSMRGVRRNRPPRWMLAWNGRIYRPLMKVMHRFGWCYMEHCYTAPETHWCHWCGMRGRK